MFLLTKCKSTPTVCFDLQGVRVRLQYVFTYTYSKFLLTRCKSTTVLFYLQGVRVRLQYVFTCKVRLQYVFTCKV